MDQFCRLFGNEFYNKSEEPLTTSDSTDLKTAFKERKRKFQDRSMDVQIPLYKFWDYQKHMEYLETITNLVFGNTHHEE